MSGYLIHRDHKYIKREWKHGHWSYEYDTAGGKNLGTGKKTITAEKDGDGARAYLNYNNDPNGFSDKKGVAYDKNRDKLYLFDTTDSTYWDNDEDVEGLNKNFGVLSVEYAEDGVQYILDTKVLKETVNSMIPKASNGKKLLLSLLKKK